MAMGAQSVGGGSSVFASRGLCSGWNRPSQIFRDCFALPRDYREDSVAPSRLCQRPLLTPQSTELLKKAGARYVNNHGQPGLIILQPRTSFFEELCRKDKDMCSTLSTNKCVTLEESAAIIKKIEDGRGRRESEVRTSQKARAKLGTGARPIGSSRRRRGVTTRNSCGPWDRECAS